jgi:hypothetical protein
MIYLQKAGKTYRYDCRQDQHLTAETVGEFTTVSAAALEIKRLKKLFPDNVYYISKRRCHEKLHL